MTRRLFSLLLVLSILAAPLYGIAGGLGNCSAPSCCCTAMPTMQPGASHSTFSIKTCCCRSSGAGPCTYNPKPIANTFSGWAVSSSRAYTPAVGFHIVFGLNPNSVPSTQSRGDSFEKNTQITRSTATYLSLMSLLC